MLDIRVNFVNALEGYRSAIYGANLSLANTCDLRDG
jgi:hypothetical protein